MRRDFFKRSGSRPNHTARPGDERLETRRLLTTVSAATLIGPYNVAANASTSQILDNGSVFETISSTVIGSTIFNGNTAIETDGTSTNVASSLVTTSKNYLNITSSGFLAYGSLAVVDVYRVSFKLPAAVTTGGFFPIVVLYPSLSFGSIDQTSSTVVTLTQVTIG